MKDDKFIMMNMDDERSKKVAEILGNKTCKKILDYLSEKDEASEKDISDALNIPINTAEYNLKKLMQAGLVEKTKNFFWSAKGKKIPTYKLARKHIVISPSGKSNIYSKLKTILPVTLLSLAGALIIRQYTIIKSAIPLEIDFALKAEQNVMEAASNTLAQNPQTFTPVNPVWVWFLGGAILAILLYTLINWRKI